MSEYGVLPWKRAPIASTPAERVAWNAAIDKAQEIVSEWMVEGRDPEMLFDQLQDAKIWTTE